MNIKQLRLRTACYALNTEDNILANVHTTIEPLHNGGFLVRQKAKPGEVVMIPESNVLFAVGEDAPVAKTK